MKYVYILGLEHSGTTLINHLISQYPNAIGLGEVAQYFSPTHMHNYIQKWGEYDVSRHCSCGKPWADCPFWGDLIQLNGLNSELDLEEKYKSLISYARTNIADDVTIVDSSKGLYALRTLMQINHQDNFNKNELYVVLMVKDIRSFTTSMNRKTKADSSVLTHLKTFNWWFNEHQNMFRFLDEYGISNITVLYEKFCFEPLSELRRIFEFLEFDRPAKLFHDHNTSHLALGNKNYILSNRNEIRYDNDWFIHDKIQLAYLLHRKARQFNTKLYSLT